MNNHINIFQELEEYKQQNPVIEETMQIYREVMPIYTEAMQIMQIMRQIEVALNPYRISTSTNTKEHTQQ